MPTRSQAWLFCCFCLVNFPGKREKAIRARRGSGETASKTGKADGEAPVFLYMKIFLHLTCLRSPTNLNPQLVWTQEAAGPTHWKGWDRGAWSCISPIIPTATKSHGHPAAPCKENTGLTPMSPSTTKQVLIFAEGCKCFFSRHENPAMFPFSLTNVL